MKKGRISLFILIILGVFTSCGKKAKASSANANLTLALRAGVYANVIKQTISQNSKIVYRPKTYALQSIWEESSEGNVNYSSLWNDPIVLGLY